MSSNQQHKEKRAQPPWGLLPDDVKASLKRREWEKTRNLKDRLKGNKPFPIQVHLRPPRGSVVLGDTHHFQQFVSSWKTLSSDGEVSWEKRGFRQLAEQNVPVKFTIRDIAELARFLGKSEENQLKQWQSKISSVLKALCLKEAKEKTLFIALIDNLETLTKLNDSDLKLLVKLIPQLKRGMGKNCYLRSLPVTYVDTKFIENNFGIIESMAAAAIDKTVKEIGLLSWLDCQDKPKDWLLVKPLCEQTKSALGGIPILRLSSDILFDYELPADHILIIENEQSCLALPEISKTIAIAGGGKNISWMKAAWLTSKQVAYWGDIDSEGFSILSDARSKLSSLTPLMMDRATVEAYRERMVEEPDFVSKEPIALTQEELNLFRALRLKKYRHTRLEQERLPMDYVEKVISAWAK